MRGFPYVSPLIASLTAGANKSGIVHSVTLNIFFIRTYTNFTSNTISSIGTGSTTSFISGTNQTPRLSETAVEGSRSGHTHRVR